MKDNGLFILFRILKWCVKAVLVITGILPLARCGSGYKESNGKVTFNGEEITDKSFVVLNDVFGKSDSGAYYKRYGVPDADILDCPYSNDAHFVYYLYMKIAGADPATFSILGDIFSKDREWVYSRGKLLAGADAARFTTFSQDSSLDEINYSKDKAHVFWKSKQFTVADVAAFHPLTLDYTTDGRQVYYGAAPVKGADPASFKVYDHGYGDADAEDGKSTYLKGVRLPPQ